MKNNYIIVGGLTVAFLLTSCGDKEEVGSTTSDATKSLSAGNTDGHNAVRDAIKSEVNSVTADMMLKVNGNIDLPPAVYSIPDSLEGRDLVQATVKWPMIAKEDLYEVDSTIFELEDQPTVVVKKFSKGDQVDYVESNFVLESDGAGSYTLNQTRFTKSKFSSENYQVLSDFQGKALIKGSEEHLAAAKSAAEIKKAKDEKARIEKLEAEKQTALEHQAAIDSYRKFFREGRKFDGRVVREGRTKSVRECVVDKVEERGGEVEFTFSFFGGDIGYQTRGILVGVVNPETNVLEMRSVAHSERRPSEDMLTHRDYLTSITLDPNNSNKFVLKSKDEYNLYDGLFKAK